MMLRRTIPSIFIIMAVVFLFSCSGSADKPDVAVESITLDSAEITLKAGETATLKATISPEDATDKSLLWTSDSESITVEDGAIAVSSTASAGEYTITVTSVSNPEVKATCTVTVEAAPAGGGGGGGGSPSGGEESQPEPDTEIDVSDTIIAGEGSAEPTQTVVSDPIPIADNVSIIKLTNLESGKMYTLYPEKNDAQPASKAFSAPLPKRASRSSSNLNSLSGGTYIFTVPEGQTEFTFYVGDMNLTAGDAFRIGEVAAPEIDFTVADTVSIVIQQGEDEPIFTRKIGDITHEIYEKFFAVDMSKVQDKEHIAFLNVLSGGGSAHASTNFGIIDAYGNDLIGDNYGSLLDFRNETTIYVYMYMEVTSAETDFILTLYLTNPEIIGAEGVNLTAPNIYMFEPSSERRVVELEFSQDVHYGSSGFNNDVGARYASTGERHPYFYPIKIEGNKMLMNLEPNIAGYKNDSIIFDFEYAPSDVTVTASVRNRGPEDMEAGVITVGAAGKKDISVTIPANCEIYPMVFKSTDGTPIKSAKVNVESFDKNEELRIIASHSYKQGSSQQVIPSYDDITQTGRNEVQFSEDEYLEYAIYRNSTDRAEKTISFTITI